MSQENVELTRRAFQAFNDCDLDAVLAGLHDEVEAFPRLAAVEGGYRGPTGYAAGGRSCSAPSLTSTWRSLKFRPRRVHSPGPALARPWCGDRHARRRGGLACESVPGRKGHPVARLHQRERSPRSRGAAGVGDVAGQSFNVANMSAYVLRDQALIRPLRPEPSACPPRARLVPGSAGAGVRVGRD